MTAKEFVNKLLEMKVPLLLQTDKEVWDFNNDGIDLKIGDENVVQVRVDNIDSTKGALISETGDDIDLERLLNIIERMKDDNFGLPSKFYKAGGLFNLYELPYFLKVNRSVTSIHLNLVDNKMILTNNGKEFHINLKPISKYEEED